MFYRNKGHFQLSEKKKDLKVMDKNKYKIYVNNCQIMQNKKRMHSNDIIKILNNRGEKLTSSMIINLYTRLMRLRLPCYRLKSGMYHVLWRLISICSVCI